MHSTSNRKSSSGKCPFALAFIKNDLVTSPAIGATIVNPSACSVAKSNRNPSYKTGNFRLTAAVTPALVHETVSPYCAVTIALHAGMPSPGVFTRLTNNLPVCTTYSSDVCIGWGITCDVDFCVYSNSTSDSINQTVSSIFTTTSVTSSVSPSSPTSQSAYSAIVRASQARLEVGTPEVAYFCASCSCVVDDSCLCSSGITVLVCNLNPVLANLIRPDARQRCAS
jgi:hypothetical protein